jgi:hypothetical protein
MGKSSPPLVAFLRSPRNCGSTSSTGRVGHGQLSSSVSDGTSSCSIASRVAAYWASMYSSSLIRSMRQTPWGNPVPPARLDMYPCTCTDHRGT